MNQIKKQDEQNAECTFYPNAINNQTNNNLTLNELTTDGVSFVQRQQEYLSKREERISLIEEVITDKNTYHPAIYSKNAKSTSRSPATRSTIF